MGVQQLQKYDGKVEDVPAQWVIDGSLAEGGPVTVNMGGEKTWAGTVTEMLYQQILWIGLSPLSGADINHRTATRPANHLLLLILLLTRNCANLGKKRREKRELKKIVS
ncbi:hypothetical protein GBAR_LOCUS1327, partial [Geodia barretti]